MINLKIIKVELKKALDSSGFLVALLIGFICIFYKHYLLIQHSIFLHNIVEKCNIYENIYTASFYNNWLICHLDTSSLYIMYFLGIIAALPYGISYVRDKKIGLIKNICTRCDKKKYLFAKYISTFITGGLATTFPLFLDFLMATIYQPYDVMRIEGTSLIANNRFIILVIDHPYLCAFLYILLWFLFGGALASVSLIISVFTDNIFTVQLTPFIVMLILFYAPQMLDIKYGKYFPIYYLTLTNGDSPLWGFIFSIVLTVLSLITFISFENHKDIL